MKWLAFGVTALLFILLASRPATRHRIAWGRTAERMPMSVVGYYGALVGVFLVFLAAFAVDAFGSKQWILLGFGGFFVFIASAIFDQVTSHQRRYRTTPTSIWIRPEHEWIELRRDAIAAVKFESVSRVIVRYYDGQRIVISLFRLSSSAYEAVCGVLRDALRDNETTRGVWSA